MSTVVRTRFAPSPTGYMHIGGMRTALFCWLWARHTGGQFILRIDDTDQERNVDSALGPIFRAFRWLGLDWDEGPDVGGAHGPYFQSQRTALYQAAIESLLASGAAYRDYETPEEIAADRQQADAEKRPYVSLRRSLQLSAAEREQALVEQRPCVVRLLVPRERTVAIDDAVRGHVEWDCGLMADPVLMRSNGSCLYNFATVVDDAQMEITHVIRAEEHLTNTAVQCLIYEALGHAPPVFAHIPFITAPGSNKKLSKRDLEKLRKNPGLQKLFDRGDAIFPQLGLGDSTTLSPVMVEYYEKLGYLPAGVLNALARLGWSLDDKTEILSLSEIVEHFTLDRIIKSPAGFDADKLLSFQSHWMGQLSPDERIDGCWPFLVQTGLVSPGDRCPGEQREFLGDLIAALGDRLKVFSDILDAREFFVTDSALTYDEAAFEKRVRKVPDAAAWLSDLRVLIEQAEPFDAAALETAIHQLIEQRGLKPGQVLPVLRLALTGKTSGVGLPDMLRLLGRERCIRRLQLAADRLAAPQ